MLGNIIEPRVQGKNLGLSPFVIIVSLTVWAYIWGTVGMIIAIPMTVIIKITMQIGYNNQAPMVRQLN